MRILGISAFFHDSAAALIDDGNIVCAVQEERFTRVKHDSRLPLSAIAHCLAACNGATPDAIVFFEKPLLKFERILSTAFAVAPRGFRAFTSSMPLWLRTKLWIPLKIEEAFAELGHDVRGRIYFSAHHESHAASAFFPSPFENASILTIDGVGEWSAATLASGRGKALRLLRELRFPHSPGLLYSAFTHHCGFRVNSGEYKLMGLAPYGRPLFRERILERLITLHDDGSLHLNLNYFSFQHGDRMTSPAFAELFGCKRREPSEELTQLHCDLARSIQEVTEEIVLRMARHLHALTGDENLCLAGGVALNCVANGRLLREGPFRQIWVQPASGDAGGALGAALAFWHGHQGAPRMVRPGRDSMQGGFLGPSYSDAAIEAALQRRNLRAERLPSSDHTAARIASAVNEGLVVGLLQGRAEFGPRALGARSILADARSSRMQSVLNLKIKFRESFRPFAPIVLAERASEFFDLQTASPYMLFTAPLHQALRMPGSGLTDLGARLQETRSSLPAITHVDYSARIQTVDTEQNPFLHSVLSHFERLTGCPVMINTSFNVRGEPPVCSPDDAIDGFLATDMDCLFLGHFLLTKTSLPVSLRVLKPNREFAPD